MTIFEHEMTNFKHEMTNFFLFFLTERSLKTLFHKTLKPARLSPSSLQVLYISSGNGQYVLYLLCMTGGIEKIHSEAE